MQLFPKSSMKMCSTKTREFTKIEQQDMCLTRDPTGEK